MARTPDEIMKESWQFWTGEIPGAIRAYSHEAAYAWLSMQAGETSYRWPFPIGDHGQAFGGFQNHRLRIDAIFDGTGIDLRDPNLSNLDCLRAADWESTRGSYRKIRPILEILTTVEACVAILVCLFEQPLEQPRDIVRRRDLARAASMKVGPGFSS